MEMPNSETSGVKTPLDKSMVASSDNLSVSALSGSSKGDISRRLIAHKNNIRSSFRDSKPICLKQKCFSRQKVIIIVPAASPGQKSPNWDWSQAQNRTHKKKTVHPLNPRTQFKIQKLSTPMMSWHWKTLKV